MLRVLGLFFIIFFSLQASAVFGQTLYVDRKIAAMELDEMYSALKDAELFNALDTSRITLDRDSECGIFLKEAMATRDALEALNSIRNKTTNNYAAQAQEAKENNERALRDYKNCYAEKLTKFPELRAEGIYTYAAHEQRFNAMVDDYNDIPDVGDYILKLRLAISKSEDAGPDINGVAVLTHVHRTVEVLTGGIGSNWKQVERGYLLREGDHVRTGPAGRARFEFTFKHNSRNAGPIVFNLGSNSTISIDRLAKNLIDSKQSQTTIQLIRGWVRTVVRNLGADSGLYVRTGTSLCGIRGTEVAISYDPVTDTADYVLNEGDAYYQTAGGPEIVMTPRTGVLITQGRATRPRSISSGQWTRLVEKTDPPFGFADTVAQPFDGLESVGQKEPHTAIQQPPADFSDPQWQKVFDKTKANNAAELVRGFIDGLKEADPDKLYQYSAGAYHKSLNERKAKGEDLRTFLQASKQRPLEYEMKCTACTGEECWTYADLMTLGDPVNPKRVIFLTRKFGMDYKVANSKLWNAETEATFKQMGQAYDYYGREAICE